MPHTCPSLLSFFFNDTATTEIYTLSLHDALPISHVASEVECPAFRCVPLLGFAVLAPALICVLHPFQCLTDLLLGLGRVLGLRDRKSTRLNSSHQIISYAVFCLKKKKHISPTTHV